MYIYLSINDSSNVGNIYMCLHIHMKVFVCTYSYVRRYASIWRYECMSCIYKFDIYIHI